MSDALAPRWAGTWPLRSREDYTKSGERSEERPLVSDPIALLYFDRTGHFAAGCSQLAVAEK